MTCASRISRALPFVTLGLSAGAFLHACTADDSDGGGPAGNDAASSSSGGGATTTSGSSSSGASSPDGATTASDSSTGADAVSGGPHPPGDGALDSGGPVKGDDSGADADADKMTADAGAEAGIGTDAGSPYGPNLVSVFDGATLDGWIQVPASSWSVVGGAMHSLGTARGYIYTKNVGYGDFRFVFTSRLVGDPANHNPCVLFWGNSFAVDALAAIQIQPPPGYMWDYRTTGPTANQSPDRFETRFGHPAVVDTQWSQCEMLGNQATGTLRFACCQLPSGTGRCKASEIVDFKDPTAGRAAPLALQVHNAQMIEEFKNLWVESPVADPTALLTTQ
jgi:Domain of Unknown Function (DUF1080)